MPVELVSIRCIFWTDCLSALRKFTCGGGHNLKCSLPRRGMVCTYLYLTDIRSQYNFNNDFTEYANNTVHVLYVRVSKSRATSPVALPFLHCSSCISLNSKPYTQQPLTSHYRRLQPLTPLYSPLQSLTTPYSPLQPLTTNMHQLNKIYFRNLVQINWNIFFSH